MPCTVSTPLPAALALLQLCRVHRDYSLPGCSGSTSTMQGVRVPRLVARLVTRLVAPLVVDYFDYAVRPGASARRVARRQLLRLRCASRCLGTSRGLSRRSSPTTSTTSRIQVPRHVTRLVAPLIIDYFAYAMRPGASARRAARLAARRRLLRLSRASGCLDMSHGSSRGSSSTTPCAATSSCSHTGSASATPCVATTCLAATLALL
jgi:hypothetical protein